jgi:hypothetical protein
MEHKNMDTEAEAMGLSDFETIRVSAGHAKTGN